jgi:xylose isomerase
MNESYFHPLPTARYAGPQSDDPFFFRWYDADRIVGGKSMREHLRFSVCYWHTFVWSGTDPFGGPTFARPWFDTPGSTPLQSARLKAEAAFELFAKLTVPFFCFHDRDVAPEGSTPRETHQWLMHMRDALARHMERTGVRLLWGTANLFSHPMYAAGAATNPDPAIFAAAAAQVRDALDVTHSLAGENYVLWGGREGYDSLLNTDMRRELDQLGRFLSMVVEHKHKIGFKGQILLEPKPHEPTKHQYDFDVASVYGFLRRYGLDQEVALNIEANHATLAGHSFAHEVALAQALGVFGSIDMNRGDPQNGWDTDQFPNSVEELAQVFLLLLREGGIGRGGLNFDAKVRRQSIDAQDIMIGHVAAMDTCARALLAAQAMLADGRFERHLRERYAGWQSPQGRAILAGSESLTSISDRFLDAPAWPKPISGRQELLEAWYSRFV